MSYNDSIIIKYDVELTSLLIDIINSKVTRYPNNDIILEIPSTKYISADLASKLDSRIRIRITGAYSDDYLGKVFKSQEAITEYRDATVYSRNELINIIREIESIEEGINPAWDKITKTVYIYDKIRNSIMYDENYKSKTCTTSEIRSLRGLLRKKTVCAGFALIFKEFLDRQNIDCKFVIGGRHAWNIVEIDGKNYPFDLTWDNNKYTRGEFNSYEYLGQKPDEFNKKHVPSVRDPSYGLEKNFSEIDSNQVQNIIYSLNANRDFSHSLHKFTRSDGSSFLLCQVGKGEKEEKKFYRYYFSEIEGNKIKNPILLYSTTNVQAICNAVKFGKKINDGAKRAIFDVLFSKENINDSLSKKTSFIGDVKSKDSNNNSKLIKSVSDINKDDRAKFLSTNRYKTYVRGDGSSFIANLVSEKHLSKENIDIYSFDIFEAVRENGKIVIRKNRVFSEKNFLKDNRSEIPNQFLSRDRLNRKVNEAGGYIGACDDYHFVIRNNPFLINFFKFNLLKNPSHKKENYSPITIPSFDELKELTQKYRLAEDLYTPFSDTSFKLYYRDSDRPVSNIDPFTKRKAVFANIWLRAAGAKIYPGEKVPGFEYAFNEETEEIYKDFVDACNASVRRNYYVNSLDLFKKIAENSNYKYAKKIAAEMFLTDSHAQFINALFQDANNISFGPDTIALKDEYNALAMLIKRAKSA